MNVKPSVAPNFLSWSCWVSWGAGRGHEASAARSSVRSRSRLPSSFPSFWSTGRTASLKLAWERAGAQLAMRLKRFRTRWRFTSPHPQRAASRMRAWLSELRGAARSGVPSKSRAEAVRRRLAGAFAVLIPDADQPIRPEPTIVPGGPASPVCGCRPASFRPMAPRGDPPGNTVVVAAPAGAERPLGRVGSAAVLAAPLLAGGVAARRRESAPGRGAGLLFLLASRSRPSAGSGSSRRPSARTRSLSRPRAAQRP